MAYSFKKADSDLSDAVQRIATSQIGTAIDEIGDPDLSRADTIRQVRKRCKKLRGLIRIVRPGFADYRAENAAFRDLARCLSDARDATSGHEAIDALEIRYAPSVAGEIFAAARAGQEARLGTLDEAGIDGLLERVRDGLSQASARAQGWTVEGDPQAVLAKGIAKTYRRSVDAMHMAAETGETDDFHDWRKRVKYHWYHLRLLARAWPDLFSGWIAAADQLAADLGDHHDLAVFRSAVLVHVGAGSVSAREALEDLMRAEQDRLEANSLARGRLLFSEDAEAAGKRLARYWGRWRAPLRA